MSESTQSNRPQGEVTHMAARIMIEKKEAAIEAALDFYYGSAANWSEEDLAANAVIEYDAAGVETFKIGADELLRFYPMTTDIEVDHSMIRCRVHQRFEVLYET